MARGKPSNIALVTGASRGIGASVAERLAADGYDIWLNYRSNHQAAEEVKGRIEALGRTCRLLPFDVSKKEQIEEVLIPALEEAVPDILVNNAGLTKDSLMVWMSDEDWYSVLDVTLTGFFRVTKACLMGMLKKRFGCIVNIASTAGESGLPGQVNYSSAKAGLIGATKSLAKEVASRGIRVNAVAPGFIETDMISELPKEEIVKGIPLKRVGKPEEIAGVVSFLCSKDAAYMTGQTVSVNGGLHM